MRRVTEVLRLRFELGLTLRSTPHGALRKTRGRVVRYSFLVGLFHSLLHAGLARRTELAILLRSIRRPVTPQFAKRLALR